MPSNVKAGERLMRKKKRKKRTKRSSEHDGSDGDLELDRELYPIGHYISDRAEMIEQMFNILKKDKIQSMLPPILKEIQWQDLKAHCLEQLNSMSEKHISRILEGKPYAPDLEDDESEKKQSVKLVSSSSSSSSSLTSSSCGESSEGSSASDIENEPSTRDKTKDKKIEKVDIVKVEPDKVEDDPDMLQIGLSPKEMGDLLEEEENTEKKIKEESEHTEISKKDKTNSDTNPEKKGEVKEGKTLLEILELEMRARAIRALLKQSGAEKAGQGKLDNANSKRRNESKSSQSKQDEASISEQEPDKVPVVIKEEALSEEEVEAEVVFVKDLHSPPKEPKKKAQRECLSAVYDASTDILKFKPTVLSSTPKLSLVDTSGNPIVLPKVKSHKNKIHDGSVIVLDGDIQEASSSKSEVVHEGAKAQKNSLKRKVETVIDLENENTDSDVIEVSLDSPKSSLETVSVVNNSNSAKNIILDSTLGSCKSMDKNE
ncbi:Caspase activity and apoptosis inhibitor 1 [Frankliniella fusca]|uniref:Caspase activity and apoptosis inhibitor 1 n=1 Tax=Frankliniella fusca TaxID=407009 RepID=A0AAE1LR80_9NEOP|nr:Caspase activity and apoptosis inhibitor 1 [Frankliniella fusca]